MTRRNIVSLCIATVCLVGAGVLTARFAVTGDRDSRDFPDGIPWVCGDCQAEFVKTVDDMLELHRRREQAEDPDAPLELLCPECGSQRVARALRCPNCDRFFVRTGQRGQPTCPHCKQPLPPLVEAGG